MRVFGRNGRSGRRFGLRRGLRLLHQRTPLRVQLIGLLLAFTTFGIGVAGATGVFAIRHFLVAQLDGQLHHSVKEVISAERAQSTGADTATGNQNSGYPGGRGQDRRQQEPTDRGERHPEVMVAFYSCVFTAEGIAYTEAQLRTPAGAQVQDFASPKLSWPAATHQLEHPFTADSVRGTHQWRVIVLATGENRFAVAAVSLDQVQDTVAELAAVALTGGVLVLLATALLGYLAIRSSLRPLMRVEATAEAIAAGDLGRRVPAGHPRTEVGSLAASVNAMLTQIENAFRDREAAASAARASEDRMRRFVADAGHELRTPLTAVRGFAQLLRKQVGPDPQVRGTVGRIEAASGRMAALVEDLLLLARLDQQRPMRMRLVDLLALTADTVAEFQVTAPEHPITLDVPVLRDGPPPVISADEIRMGQVLSNLLGNAVTHTPPGTRVAVTVTTTPVEAVLIVADDGPGLTPEVASRVFERFYREDTSRTRASGGSGLGLSIVAALVQAHGGTVRVNSTPGAGAAFEVRLPLGSTALG